MSSPRFLALVAVTWAATASAQSGGNIYLSQGKVLFQALDFEKCVQRMAQAARWEDSTRKEQAEVELYSGLCKFSLGQTTEADDHFTVALQLDPTLQLPPGVSPRISDAFAAVAAKVRPATAGRAEAGAAQPDREDAPSRELVLVPKDAPGGTANPALDVKSDRPSRVLPITLGGVSVAAAVAGGIFGNLARTYESQHNDRTTYHAEAQQAGRNASNAATAANIGFGVAVTAAVGAVTTLLLDL